MSQNSTDLLSPTCSSSSSQNLDDLSNKLPSEMTASYSEIAGTNSLGDASLENSGRLRREGNMTHFVADDLEFKIKLASPTSCAPTDLDIASKIFLLDELEYEAKKIAHSVDNLTENLSGILHSNSSLAVKNVLIYENSVCKTCTEMDSSIRSMYSMLAKSEELLRAMEPVQAQVARVAQLKRLVQILESNV